MKCAAAWPLTSALEQGSAGPRPVPPKIALTFKLDLSPGFGPLTEYDRGGLCRRTRNGPFAAERAPSGDTSITRSARDKHPPARAPTGGAGVSSRPNSHPQRPGSPARCGRRCPACICAEPVNPRAGSATTALAPAAVPKAREDCPVSTRTSHAASLAASGGGCRTDHSASWCIN